MTTKEILNLLVHNYGVVPSMQPDGQGSFFWCIQNPLFTQLIRAEIPANQMSVLEEVTDFNIRSAANKALQIFIDFTEQLEKYEQRNLNSATQAS
jgi:hypothetical protein